MKHLIIVKYKDSVKNKEKISAEAENLFSQLVGTLDGIHSVKAIRNCVDISNRYDLMIVIDMDREALESYKDCEVHLKWKREYSQYLEKKCIFDCE